MLTVKYTESGRIITLLIEIILLFGRNLKRLKMDRISQTSWCKLAEFQLRISGLSTHFASNAARGHGF